MPKGTKNIIPISESTKEVTLIQNELQPLTERVESLTISAETMEEATILLSRLNLFNDRITTEKEKITRPLNEALKVERSRWKPLETLYQGAISILRGKLSIYQTEARRLESEEEAKIAARVGEGKGHLKIDTAVAKIESIERADRRISTEAGTLKFQTIRSFEIEDITKLPQTIINEVLNRAYDKGLIDQIVREHLKLKEELTGVRYFDEERPINLR